MASKKNTSGNKPTKKTVKKTTAKKAVKKTSAKTPTKKSAKKASPKKSVTKKATAKKSVKSAGKKTTVKSSPKNVTTKSPKAAKKASKTAASSKLGGIFGSNFLFTGTLSGMQRKEAEALVKANGGSILSGVSAKLNYLVAGADAGSKLAKAKALKTIKILNENEFLKMVSRENSNALRKSTSPTKSSLTVSNKVTTDMSHNLNHTHSSTSRYIVLDYEAFENGISEEDIKQSELNGDECELDETGECMCYRCAREKLNSLAEDHAYIESNLLEILPVSIIGHSVLNQSGIYVLRYYLYGKLNVRELVDKYLDEMKRFCENPDWSIIGTKSFSIYDSPEIDKYSIHQYGGDKFKDFNRTLNNRLVISAFDDPF